MRSVVEKPIPVARPNAIYHFKRTDTGVIESLTKEDLVSPEFTGKRSPIEKEIGDQLSAIDLSKGKSEQLVDNLGEYGFAVLETTGLEKKIIQRAFDAYEDFCKKPFWQKKQLRSSNPGIYGRYGLTNKVTKREGHRFLDDLTGVTNFFKEQAHVRWRRTDSLGLKEAAKEIINVLDTNGQKVFEHVAKLLSLEPDFFKEYTDDSDRSELRLIHCISHDEAKANPAAYPIVEGKKKVDLEGLAQEDRSCVQVHTDWGMLTVLPKATQEGLEFWYDDKKNQGLNSGWVRLPAKEGQLIVMPGNMMEIVTGGKIRSIPHRVVTNKERSSIAYFLEAHQKTDVDLLKQKLVKLGVCNEDDISFFESDIRQYLKPDQPITVENYMAFMGSAGERLKVGRLRVDESEKLKKLGFNL